LTEVFQKQFPSIKKIRDISYIFTKCLPGHGTPKLELPGDSRKE